LLGDRGYEEGTDPEIDRELAFARDVVERLAETTSILATSARPSSSIGACTSS
jgi:hypothetical protein